MKKMMDSREIVGIVRAKDRGEEIQYNALINDGADGWITMRDDDFEFAEYEYRVKPEPREFWLIRGSREHWVANGIYEVKQIWVPEDGEQIHVREVL